VKHQIPLVVALLALPGLASAQFSADPLIALGFIAGKSQCAKRFGHMRANLDSAFEAFIKKNNKFFDAEMWHRLDSYSLPFTNELSEADCKAFLLELPSLDVDKVIERVRREVECVNEADALYERLGPQRPRIGIDFGERSLTPTIRAVSQGSPASLADLRPGDVIRAVGGTSIETSCDAALAVMKLTPGEAVEFSVARDDSVFKVKIAPVAGAK
jgi:C-terminal processing protease CtpA/Prc